MAEVHSALGIRGYRIWVPTERFGAAVGDHQGISLDPEDVDVLLVGDPASDEGQLEFHLSGGVSISIETA